MKRGRLALLGVLALAGVGAAVWFLFPRPNPTEEPHESAAWYCDSGDKNAKTGQVTAAVIDYNRAIAIAPKDPRPYIGLAVLYEVVNRPDMAVETLEQLQAVNPEARELPTRLAEAYLGVEDLKNAREVGAKAVEREPASLRAHTVYGTVLARFRYWDSAMETLKRARTLAPKDPEVAAILLDVTLQKGAFDEAIALGEELVALSPDSSKLHYKLGYAYGRIPQQADSADRALRHLKRAAEIEPKWFEPRAEMGRLYQVQGKNKEAISAFEEAWKLNPLVPGVAYNLVTLWRKTGDPRAAAMDRRFKELLKEKEKFTALRRDYNTSSDDAPKVLALAETEGRTGLYAVALHRLRKLLTADPANLKALQLYQRFDLAARSGYPNYLRPGPGIGPPPA